MKKICLFIWFCSFSVFANNKISNFQKKVNSICPESNISSLLLKKSLIEFIHGEECPGKFTSIILTKCSQLDCRELTDIYRQIQQTRPGSVVGDE